MLTSCTGVKVVIIQKHILIAMNGIFLNNQVKADLIIRPFVPE
jgi:hypothetical protein